MPQAGEGRCLAAWQMPVTMLSDGWALNPRPYATLRTFLLTKRMLMPNAACWHCAAQLPKTRSVPRTRVSASRQQAAAAASECCWLLAEPVQGVECWTCPSCGLLSCNAPECDGATLT
eukprot:364282-Chlamydomonas_euryale.AAC.2